MDMRPHSFTLRQLQYVVAVADALSFRKAAERCRVAQPSLSAQIALLETAMGVPLFERDRRRVLPTTAGQLVIARARKLLMDADDLVTLTKQAADPLAGTLRLGVIPTISAYLLPSVTPALRVGLPRLAVVWVEDKTQVLVRDLAMGVIDAALLALEAELGEVEHEVLAVDEFVLATRRGDPLGRKPRPVGRNELGDVDVLLLDDGHCFREQALSYCTRAKAHELEFRATSLSTLAQMVAGGTGVTLLPRLAVATEAQRATLEIRPFAAPVPSRTIALVWRKRSPLGVALRQLADVLREAYPHALSSRPRRARSKTKNRGRT